MKRWITPEIKSLKIGVLDTQKLTVESALYASGLHHGTRPY